jgi:hypothetical protein
MRRLLTSLMGFVLLSSALGCCICGKCDCVPYEPCAGGCCLGGDHHLAPSPAAAGQIIQAEPLKTMPTGADK